MGQLNKADRERKQEFEMNDQINESREHTRNIQTLLKELIRTTPMTMQISITEAY